MINVGTDVIGDWSFTDGDVNIVDGTGNLGQAIQNRLNTYIGDLSDFYNEYGSNLFDYMGELNHPTIHEYIKSEIEFCVVQDKRISSVDCTVSKVSNKQVKCLLQLTLVDGTDMDLSMILTNENAVILGVN